VCTKITEKLFYTLYFKTRQSAHTFIIFTENNMEVMHNMHSLQFNLKAKHIRFFPTICSLLFFL